MEPVRVFKRLTTISTIKRAYAVGQVQFHMLVEEGVVDPLRGQNDEHDRLSDAFTELFYLEQRVREEAQAIFEKYNLDGHEFGASLHFSSER